MDVDTLLQTLCTAAHMLDNNCCILHCKAVVNMNHTQNNVYTGNRVESNNK